MMLQTIIVCSLMGLIMGLILYALRSSIDQRRGAVNEVIGCSLPILVAAILIQIGGVSDYGEFGMRLAPVAEIVFIALPLLVIVRWGERMRQGESLQIGDLFRMTTVIALMMFVFSSLLSPLHATDIAIATLIYVAAEKSLHSSRPGRNLAIVFSLCFVIATTANVLFVRLLFGLLSASDLPAMIFGFDEGGFALVALIGALVLSPWVFSNLAHYPSWHHRLAAAVSVWRFNAGHPQDLITVRPLMNLWHFRPGVCFLNHGSFGAVPMVLRIAQRRLRAECEEEPMDFLARQVESRWLDARFKLATWLGTKAENIAFCENATAGMNEIANWFPLSPGDEVLLNDHEYGAVRRVWQRKCDSVGASLVTATLPMPFESQQQIVDAILAGVNERTKLVILSHITSPTAVCLPVETLCEQLSQREVATCIDGPHALLQETVKLYRLPCDFYVASCHKWLCAPVGSGFIYAAPKWHGQIKSLRLSWGRVQPKRPESWTDELLWTGTRDYSAYLTVPHAIRFFESFDTDKLDQRNHALACYARERLSQLPGAEPVTPEGREWFGWLVAVWLPAGDHSTLQQRLWQRHKIEVPIVHFRQRYLVRVSCHLYNTTHDIDYLLRALRVELCHDQP